MELEYKAYLDNEDNQDNQEIEIKLADALTRIKSLELDKMKPQLSVAAMSNETSAYKSAFFNYVRKGIDYDLKHAEYDGKSLSTVNDPDGGYLVPLSTNGDILSVLEGVSFLRPHATQTTISTDALEMLIDKDDAFVGWVAERDLRGETKTPELQRLRINVHEMYANPRATEKLLEDAMINVEDWLTEKIAQKMADVENEAFINGDGHNKPRGFMSYEFVDDSKWGWGKIGGVFTGENGKLQADNLFDVISSLKPQYLGNAKWFMSRSSFAHLRKLKTTNGEYLLNPVFSEGEAGTLLGYPIVLLDNMPGIEEGKPSTPIVFGDMKRTYQIVDRSNFRLMRDPYSAKPYVEFYVTKRVGGDVVNFESIKALSCKE